MKIKATPIKGEDLKPGDLFSTAPQSYWDDPGPGSIGERVYIRMNTPAEWAPDFDSYVYKITIEKEESNKDAYDANKLLTQQDIEFMAKAMLNHWDTNMARLHSVSGLEYWREMAAVAKGEKQ